MKKIRYSTFETNSSSEHSISIAKKNRYLSWKNGNEDMYAREKPKHSEFPNTWGNFWSYQYYWEFNIFSPEELREKNFLLLEEHKVSQIKWIDSLIRPDSTKESVDYYKERISYTESLTLENLDPFHKYIYNLYITYEEYQAALRNDDCDSPFEHINETEDVVVFGKYFHS